MNRREDGQDSTIFLFFSALIIVFVGIPAAYAAKAELLNGAFLSLAKLELRPFLAFSGEAQKAWAHINTLNPAAMSWTEMQNVLSYCGKWARWPLFFLLTLLGVASIFMGRVAGLVRRFDMARLLENNSESFSCLKPIVGRGKYLLSPESRDSGIWRVARSPIQFALEHGLLVQKNGSPFTEDEALKNGLGHIDTPAFGNAHYDASKALEVFTDQLGPHLSFEHLTPLRKTLAAAFLAYAGGKKEAAIKLLDDASSSYDEKNGQGFCPILETESFQSRVNTLLEAHQGIARQKKISRHSSYVLPWFMALLYQAREKGVLASSQFLFVRPLDRPLWYTLNQCGGRVAWPEAFAPWAHFMAEKKSRGILCTATVSGAVEGLREALKAQGWLRQEDTPPPLPTQNEAPPAATTALTPVVAVAEPDAEPEEEYSAHNDQALKDEMF